MLFDNQRMKSLVVVQSWLLFIILFSAVTDLCLLQYYSVWVDELILFLLPFLFLKLFHPHIETQSANTVFFLLESLLSFINTMDFRKSCLELTQNPNKLLSDLVDSPQKQYSNCLKMVGKVPGTSGKQQNLCEGCGPVSAPLIPVQLCDNRHRGQFNSPLYVAGAYQMKQMVLEMNELSCFVDGNRSADRGCITWGFLINVRFQKYSQVFEGIQEM